MGVGLDPADLLEVVERGVDMFDCVAPTRLARHGMLFTSPPYGGGAGVVSVQTASTSPMPLLRATPALLIRLADVQLARHAEVLMGRRRVITPAVICIIFSRPGNLRPCACYHP